MISFLPSTDAYYNRLSRDQPEGGQNCRHHPQQRHDHRISVDCLCLGAEADSRKHLQQLSSLSNAPDDNSHIFSSDTDGLSIESMHTDTWHAGEIFMSKAGRPFHQRESSSSSVGSTGPASPFAGNANIPNPQIAITDLPFDGLGDIHSNDMSASQGGVFCHAMKPMLSFSGRHNMESAITEKMAYPVTIPGPFKRQRADRRLLPAPEFAAGCSQSHAGPVASPVAEPPPTPGAGDIDQMDRRRRRGRQLAMDMPDSSLDLLTSCPEFCNVPKLDRTMTDVYGDELYSPNFAITSTSPSQNQTAASPTNDIFSQRINAANSQHLSAAHSPSSTTSRTRSPFRTCSPFAPSSSSHANWSVFNATHRMSEERKTRHELSSLRQRGERAMEAEIEPETPKTISPKDAILEFSETDADGNFPLFPQDATTFDVDQAAKGSIGPLTDDLTIESNICQGIDGSGHASFLPPQTPACMHAPQQYPSPSGTRSANQTPPRLSSSGSSSVASQSSTPINDVAKPPRVGADAGTYTCTYHGCTQRFETPLLLQKHKREGHRQTQGPCASSETGITPGMLNTQAGPHRCDRINPSTGKPCSTVFSRPYDLTRHEDTIHNARKQKVRCDLCTEEKTFSRADALTRHYRVCHPDVELPGAKHKRRGGP